MGAAGKCAKFFTYKLMEKSTNIIIHSETIDKWAVQNRSPHMEREAVLRSLNYLKDKIVVNEITTDSFTSVTKMLGGINFELWQAEYISL